MLDKKTISEVLGIAMSTGGDFAELFIEDRLNTGYTMMKGEMDKALSGREFGIGLRIFNGLNSVYTYMSGNDKSTLMELARRAAATLSGVPKYAAIDLKETPFDNKHLVKIMPNTVESKRKADLMRAASHASLSYSSDIQQVIVHYLDYKQNILIANTEGMYTQDERVRTRFYVTSVAGKDGKMESGSDSKGAGKGFELFDEVDVVAMANESARMATTMLQAGNAPSGKFPVVLESGFGGVIFHEACGHGLEATAVAKGNSVYAGKLGQKIASPLVNAVDDGTIPNEWGSLNIDDEGHQTQRNVLFENGVLKGYLIDRLNGRRMKMEATGSSRRENYKYAPTSRMTNTYILQGNATREQLFEGIEYGLYASKLGGGSVNTVTGDFNFSVGEGYLIKNGVIDQPVKGASLIGTGLEVLQKIEAVSNNFKSAEGMCGSISGSIPAGLGQPAIRVSELTVGGREE